MKKKYINISLILILFFSSLNFLYSQNPLKYEKGKIVSQITYLKGTFENEWKIIDKQTFSYYQTTQEQIINSKEKFSKIGISENKVKHDCILEQSLNNFEIYSAIKKISSIRVFDEVGKENQNLCIISQTDNAVVLDKSKLTNNINIILVMFEDNTFKTFKIIK